MNESRVDLCVIGAGSAGLSVAATAALLGVRTVLFERDRMGGECLNTGCVPSKSLLAAAKVAHTIRTADVFGIDARPSIDFKRTREYVHSVIKAIAPHDSVERFQGLGVDVVRAEARFTGPRTIATGCGRVIHARRVVIATGSAPAVPPIPGLDRVKFFTNENIFENDVLPEHLIVLGAGPIGIEIGHAYRRLGAAVTVLERATALPKDDQELARALLTRLSAEGMAIREGADVKEVRSEGGRISVEVVEAGRASTVQGTHLLIATGRKPRIEGMGLQEAGVAYNDKGVVVDDHLQTTARGVYAAGDVVDAPHFTHVCSYHAGVIIKNALFHLPAKVNYRSLPWVTYTDPELAQVGLTEEQARKEHGDDIRVVRIPFAANDRARAEGQADGLLKLVTTKAGKVLGASILGAHAGELTHLWVVAIEQGLKLRDLAQMIAPYPTWGELNKAAASEFSRPMLTSRVARTAVRVMSWLP
jgi:pyruvate/2-oxoglutarate dehydrogenase complex dihydrolipoamide dehydrogenase (E3) component